MILALGVLAGWLLGRLRGGRTRRLADPGFSGLWMPVAAAMVQMLSGPLSAWLSAPQEKWYFAIVIVSYTLSLGFIAKNLRPLAGSLPAAAGTFCNFVVIACNGWRMPVSAGAAALPELVAPAERVGYFFADETTRLWLLGDVIPFPIPWIGGYLSIGDLLLFAGVAWMVTAKMTQGILRRPLR